MPSGWTLTRILLATGVMSETIRLMPTPNNLLTLATTIAAGAATYLGVIILMFPECRALIGPAAVKLWPDYA
jgi:hypothetical protein